MVRPSPVAVVLLAVATCLVTPRELASAPGPVALSEFAPAAKASPVRHVSTRTYVTSRAKGMGWTGREMECLDRLLWAESGWRLHADNPHSTAYGLFQILRTPPGTPLAKQVERGFRYITHRHGTPCKAWAFHRIHNYY